jgi:hypothetical protein
MALSKKMQELTDAISRSRQSLLKHVDGLSDAQLGYKPDDGEWSLNDILHHLALTDEANGKLTSRALKHAHEKNVPPDPTPDASVLNCLDAAVASLNTKAQAPDFVRPQSHLSAPESLARLAASRERMLQSIEQLCVYDLTQLKYPHPVLGELDMYQWILIAGGHEGRHVAQIKRIKAESGFPAN